MRWGVLLLSLFFLTNGCADRERDTVAPVLPTRLDIGHGVSFNPPNGWWLVHLSHPSRVILTADGIDIDALEFRTGIRDSTPIFEPSAGPSAEDPWTDPRLKRASAPVVRRGIFRGGMSETEVAEAVVAGLTVRGYGRIETENLRPAAFGATHGFRFDMKYVDEQGMEAAAIVVGAMRGGELDILMFRAPAEYLFGLRLSEAEQAFASIQTP